MDGTRGRSIGRPTAALVLVACVLLTLSPGARAAAVTVHPIPTGDSGPVSLITGPGGSLYFGESNVFKIGEFSPAAPGTIHEFPLPVPTTSAGTGFDGPEYLTSSGGRIWAITDDFGTLYAMNPNGTLSVPLHWDGSDASGLAPDDAGGVWIFDQNGTFNGQPAALQRLDPPPPTYPLTAYNTDDINQQFRPITISPDGHTAWYAEDTVGQVDLVSITDTGQQTKLPVPLTNQTFQVTSMAFSSNGTLWFTMEDPPAIGPGSTGGAVGELPPGSTTPRIVYSENPEPLANDIRPTSLTPGPGGTMYFAYKQGIGQITAGGVVTLGDLSPYAPRSVDYGPDGNLWFVDNQANSIGSVAPASLFGAATPLPTGPGPVVVAPRALLSFPKQRLSAVRRRRRLSATCALAGAGTCTVAADVTARTARQLHLKVAKKAKTVTLASASRTLKKQGRTTLTLTLSTRTARALTHTRTLKLSVKATSSARGAVSESVSKTLTLTR